VSVCNIVDIVLLLASILIAWDSVLTTADGAFRPNGPLVETIRFGSQRSGLFALGDLLEPIKPDARRPIYQTKVSVDTFV
jgi:hypothetical protein